MTQIRFARRDDAPAIVELIRELATFEALPGPDQDAAARLANDAFGASPKIEILVAEDAEQGVIGYAIFFHSYSTFLARSTLFLEDLFVRPRARRRGVARALLERLRALATERQCGRFEWFVLDWNVDAFKLYEAIGAKRMDAWRLCRVELQPAKPSTVSSSAKTG